MIEKLKARLVDCWSQAWRWYSMWMHVVGTTLASVLLLVPTMPDEIQQALPLSVRAVLIAAWAVAGIAARLIQQKA